MLYFRCPKNFTPGMKNNLFPIVGAVLLFASCKEAPPTIDFGPSAKDTSFMAVTETQLQRMIVVEEFTGTKCPQCPQGHVLIKSLEDANPGRIASMGIQVFNFSQGNPVDEDTIKTRHDNRTQIGTKIGDEVFGAISAMPTAGIDRTVTNGSMLLGRNDWTGAVSTRLGVVPAANVAISSNYNAATRQAVITVHVAYTSAVTKPQNLSVAIVENNIVDAQEGVGATGYQQDYVHQHVFRDALTPPTGAAILTDKSMKQPGQVYERTFVYNVNADWNPDNCEIIAFISNNQGADREIVQGAEVHLK